MSQVQVCVLGSGIIGLSTAVRLQQAVPGINITIVADKFGRETVSDVAAGLHRMQEPKYIDGYEGARCSPETDIWLLSLNRYREVLKNHPKAGVISLFGYDIFPPPHDKVAQHPLYLDLKGYDDCRKLPDEELYQIFPYLPEGCKGFSFTTALVSPRTYLPWLMARFKESGGELIKKHIDSLDELLPRFDIVVNCSGVVAGSLTDDKLIGPSRGQVYRANIPELTGQWWMLHFPSLPLYYYHTPDGTVLGGTKQVGDWTKEARAEEKKIIFEGFSKYLPHLKNLEERVLSERVGHRPQRVRIRMEKEKRLYHGKEKWILHHYGHGASGIGLSWGSACLAVEMLEVLIQRMQKSKL